ncbi:MAG: hypothetical protein IJQ36_09515 [Oscillospiraceae bacterium]|nr:hypothetical protein [Oscillospiraceae bacterium]
MQKDLIKIARRYPQLLLPIRAGMRQTEEYKSAVLGGEIPETEPDFRCPAEIRAETADTPAGRAEILYLGDREDFLHAYQALAYRCEPTPIPDSVGAVTIGGLINWEKIHSHRDAYLASGGEDWDAEFDRFTAEKTNYLDRVILLSGGNYSNVPPEEAGLSAAEWKEKSYLIRKFHELTHFICRGLYPEDIDALRDEVIADSIGLTAAFGFYDARLARRFLGVQGGVFHEGGRLSHYANAEELPAAVQRVNAMIDDYAARIEGARAEGQDVFTLLLKIFP